MNWLFRCNIASERYGGEVVQGIGHAMRCISLAGEVEDRGGSTLLSVEGDSDVEPFLDEQNIEYVRNGNHCEIAEEFDADIIVIDINYLNPEVVRRLKEIANVVNLAPRGKTKYYADFTFTSEPIKDVPRPKNAEIKEWYSGPEYTIINNDFSNERQRLIDQYGESVDEFPQNNTVIVHMGGVDKHNRTGTVLTHLDEERFEHLEFEVIAGPFNPHTDQIKQLCEEKSDNVSMTCAPKNLAKKITGTRFGILGTGISTYEALAVGVPSFNVGASEFHDQRGDFLERECLGFYIGNYERFDEIELNDILKKRSSDGYLIKKQINGFDLVDGYAARRIVDHTCDVINDY